ncbi:MAG: hypothetical protein D6724_01305 [Armatimonadetes bacterium]|nr:MAG: hypothetical protein D6724_01305 [Armatimonadota bacterium]
MGSRLAILFLFVAGCAAGPTQTSVEPLEKAAKTYGQLNAISGVIEEANITPGGEHALQKTFSARRPDEVAVLIVRNGEPLEKLVCKGDTVTRLVFKDKLAVVTKGKPMDVAALVPGLRFFFHPESLTTDPFKKMKLIREDETPFGEAWQYESVAEVALPEGKAYQVQAGFFVEQSRGLIVGGYEKGIGDAANGRLMTWRLTEFKLDDTADLTLLTAPIPEDYKIQRQDGETNG